MILRIDLETYSDIDIMKSGVYKYVESPNFEILMIGYKYKTDEGEVVEQGLIDLKDPLEFDPEEYAWFGQTLFNPDTIKTAFNANFEITCLTKHMGVKLNQKEWRCTKVQALQMGLPGNLAGVAKALGLEQQKDTRGKALINYFSKPCKPTKKNGGRVRNLPAHDPEKWAEFCSYCIQDVEVEDAIADRLSKYPIKDSEQYLWTIDQEIISDGVLLDMTLVNNAVECASAYNERLMKRAQEITGLVNPNSVAQIKTWLEESEGEEVTGLSKATVKDLLGTDLSDSARELMEIRQELGKTSIKKYEAMQRAVCTDGRVRGLLEFCGASRTARWAGRLVQVQNLPQNKLPDLHWARQLLIKGDYEMFEMLYGNVPDTLSQLIRTAFVASPGGRFIVADFSAIEARVLAWVAKEQWRLDVFATHGKIYEASASQMFKVPLESIGKGSPLRQKGKVAELACIAEGSLVLTDFGLVPIEDVQRHHKLWDGSTWVRHGGVVFKGVKEVIVYEGLTATADHLIWIEGKSEPVQFGVAAACGAHLTRSGYGRHPIRVGESNKSGEKMESKVERSNGFGAVHRMLESYLGVPLQSETREIKGVSSLFSVPKNTEVVRPKIHGCQTEMRKPQDKGLRKLWGAWHKVQFRISHRGGPLDDRELRLTRQGFGDRQRGCEWKLRTRKPQVGNSSAKLSESTKVYDLINAGPLNRFTVSGVLVHNCGYQGGINALKSMDAKWASTVPDHQLKELIDAWREANPNIVKLWSDAEKAAIAAVKNRRTVSIQYGIKFSFADGCLFITLPSGRKLTYFKAALEPDDYGRDKLTYYGTDDKKGFSKLRTYGGKLVENCLTGDSLVLTDRGWVQLIDIKDTDLIWDGIELCSHGGLAYQGIKEVIEVSGVKMTPDHKVLTDKGWSSASQSEGLNRREVWVPSGDELRRVRWEKVDMECQMRLRKDNTDGRDGTIKNETEVVRLYERSHDIGKEKDPRYVKAPRLCSVEVNARKMQQSKTQSLSQLWRQRHLSLRVVVDLVREVLAGYGGELLTRSYFGQARRKWRLFSRQLWMENIQGTGQKQEEQRANGHSLGSNDCGGGGRKVWSESNHPTLQNKGGCFTRADVHISRRHQQVYDIINVGERHRFVVLGSDGPFIVHNCIQAIARDCLAESIVRLKEADYRTVMHVHDEVILDTPKDPRYSMEEVVDIMGQPIDWAPGLILTADAYETYYYRKD